MRMTARRPVRLRSAQSTAERWKPSLAFVIAAAGLIAGAFLGLRGRLDPQAASLQEHYLLLVSDLHAEGVSLSAVRDRLVTVGFADPTVAVLAVADRLATSPSQVDQQAAAQLHQFADALTTGNDASATAAAPVAAPTVAATPVVQTTATTAPVVTDNSTTPLPSQAATVVATAGATANGQGAVPAAANADSSTPDGKDAATVKSSDRQPVFLRKDATTKSGAVANLPYGAQVQIQGVVQGQALTAGEARWYKVTYDGHDGYVYAKYVQLGG